VNARAALEKKGYALDARDILKDAPPRAFLEKHMDEKNMKDFVSARSPQYKALGWDRKLPPKKAVIDEMLRSPNLIRRPVIVDGAKAWFGFDKKRWEAE
jgi:arsenate reductase-like glutaredoxin family protein